MSGRILLAVSIAVALLCPFAVGLASADIGPPAHLQVSEREPGVFVVRWRVPDVLPSNAVPTPQLPPGCEPEGGVEVSRATGAWLFTQTWSCSGSLAGGEIGLRFPFPDLSLTTVARVDLLSGDRYARLLTPGEPPWRLPQGTATVDPLRAARDAVLLGVTHAVGSLAHIALICAVALLGRVRRPLWLLGVFTAGQVAGASLAAIIGLDVGAGLGEVAVGLAAALLAAEALRPAAGRRRLFALAGVAGVFHGAAVGGLLAAQVGGEASGQLGRLAAILGMDAAQILGAYVLFLLFALGEARARRRAVDDATGQAVGDATGWTVDDVAGRAVENAARQALRSSGTTPRPSSIDALVRPASQPAAHRRPALRTAVPRGLLAYGAGSAGAAVALAVAFAGGAASAGSVVEPASLAPATPTAGAATPASQRVAPGAPESAVQSFLAVEPFELRHEVMLRLVDLAPALGLDPATTLPVARQPAVTEQLTELVLEHTSLSADGAVVAPTMRGVDFMSVDATGALPRPTPRPESVDAAMVGVVVVYPTEGVPSRVALSWTSFPDSVTAIPVTVIDPEAVQSTVISPPQATMTWNNELIDDPIPDIAAVAVEPATFPVPWLALPLFVVAAWALARSVRGERRAEAAALARVVLALALVIGPLAATSIAVPGSGGRVPSEAQARRLLAGLLPNVYRALEFRDEARIYDRLAITVTGDALTDIYLQQRRALELEERGGAVARVEAVEVIEARDIEPVADGFSVRGTWTVGGMVTHFGHRHFRSNRYDARVGIVAVDGSWKIRGIEVLEQERVQ